MFSFSCISAGLSICQYFWSILFINLNFCIHLLVCLRADLYLRLLPPRGPRLLCTGSCPPEVSHSKKQPLSLWGWQEKQLESILLCTASSLWALSTIIAIVFMAVSTRLRGFCWGFCYGYAIPSVSWGSTRGVPVRSQFRGAAVALLAI